MENEKDCSQGRKKVNGVSQFIISQIDLIEQLLGLVYQMKQLVIQQFDSSIYITKKWIQNLEQKDSLFINEIQQINHCYTSKLYPKLDQFNRFKEYQNCLELFMDLELSSQKFTQNQQQEQTNEGFQQQLNDNKQEIVSKDKIKLQLIDQPVKQNEQCSAIVFDSSASIMVSTSYSDIKVWSFLNGTIKLVKTLEGHTHWIKCLVYSNKQNSFISGSSDKTIRCWQQLKQNDWISSQPFQQHTSHVRCIILNSNEDFLFSGSADKSIKVWKVDFNQNQLKFQYSLDKHNNSVMSLSLNQSENYLVSCADDQNQIIIWERRENDQFEFKYFVKQSISEEGYKVNFIKENQFIWITGSYQIDKLYVFELEQGVFQENQDKIIQLITNNQIVDSIYFPIIYNKERKLILVRHKTYIYIIREINDSKYKIYDQLNCETNFISGTITNNGYYVVYWDNKKQGYSTFELLNQ